MEDKDFVEGFNAGYTLQKHHSDLATNLSQAVQKKDDEFFQGFTEGSRQYDKERTQSKTINRLKEASKKLPRPTEKRKDSPNKDLEIDR